MKRTQAVLALRLPPQLLVTPDALAEGSPFGLENDFLRLLLLLLHPVLPLLPLPLILPLDHFILLKSSIWCGHV